MSKADVMYLEIAKQILGNGFEHKEQGVLGMLPTVEKLSLRS